MKRIEFIAPVEAMRGNLSGKQNLVYAENDNKAYESPVGGVNYARNYTNRFIGAKRAKDGLKYFAVKTRTATHLTAKAKKAMAILGGAGSLYASLVRTKASAIYVAIYAQWLALQDLGSTTSFRNWVMGIFMEGLRKKVSQFVFAGPNTPSYVVNPWTGEAQTDGCAVSTQILGKFWTELAINGIVFTLDGRQGVAIEQDTFATLVASDYNTLNLSIVEESGTSYVKSGALYILNAYGGIVLSSALIDANMAYTTSATIPA